MGVAPLAWLQMTVGTRPSHLVDLAGARITYHWDQLLMTIILISGVRVEIDFSDARQMEAFAGKFNVLLERNSGVIDAAAEDMRCASARIVP